METSTTAGQIEPASSTNAQDESQIARHGSEDVEPELEKQNAITIEAAGVARVEGMQVVWGRHGKKILWFGLGAMLLAYQFDHVLLYNYRNYAASDYNNVAGLSTLGVAGTIVFAVAKPPIAKISDVIGRGEVYVFCILCYLLGYILCASSSSFSVYAGGYIFANLGMTGANILNDIIITDISSMRWRAFAISMSFVPFLVCPWISGYIVEDVMSSHGVGWRWGIGMFAIIMPVASAMLIGPLFFFQHRAKKLGVVVNQPMSIGDFCSLIDLGGTLLLAAGFAMFLVPFTLAASTPSKWSTGYIIALIVLGGCTIIGLGIYEAFVAKHPILPARYTRNASIMLCCSLGALDTLGFQATQTYLYTWAVVVQNMGPRDATFLSYTNGVVQCFFGITAGLLMWYFRRYKWLMVAGTIIKLIGYCLMIRLRGASNSWAEIFVVQAIQGIGSGFIEIIIIVGAQIVVPRDEQAQVTALVLLSVFLGASVGNAIAGAIYSSTFRDALRRHLGAGASQSLIDAVYETITSASIPETDSDQRLAVNLAYSDVLRSISYLAVGTCAVCVILALLLPNQALGKGKTLVDGFQDHGEISDGHREKRS